MQRKAIARTLLISLFLICLWGFVVPVLAGDEGGKGGQNPLMLLNTEEYVIGLDVMSGTGGIMYTIPEDEETVVVPVRMYATDTTGAGSGLDLYEFLNVIYYDPDELMYVGFGSEVWDTTKMDVDSAYHDPTFCKVEVHAYDDTVAFANDEWMEVYYLKFKIKCVGHDETELDLTLNELYSEDWVKVVGSSSLEQYDTMEEGFVYVMAYWVGLSLDTVETWLGEDTVDVDVFVDSTNYKFYAFKNYIRFDSAHYDFAGILRNPVIENWNFLYAYSQYDSIYVLGLTLSGNIGPFDTTVPLYTLRFISKLETDDITSPISFIESDSTLVLPYACTSLWEDVDIAYTGGQMSIPEYKFYGMLDFIDQGGPGDTVTLAIKVKSNFPAGLSDIGDIQMLIKHDERFNYFNNYHDIYDSVSISVTYLNDSLIGINLNLPNGKPGYVPPLEDYITYVELELEIDENEDYGCPDGMYAIFDTAYAVHYATRVVDTTGTVPCNLANEKFEDTPDTLYILCSEVYADNVSGTGAVYQPFYVSHNFELDSIYVEFSYNTSNLCKISHTLANGITLSVVDNNTYSLHGQNLGWEADDGDWLATVRWGSKRTAQTTIDLDNAEVYDDNDNLMYTIETDGTVTHSGASVYCPSKPITKDGSSLPGEFTLYQNRPNPFNPITIISFDLPDARQVNLEIYNILGQKVASLVDDFLEAGHYDIEWDASKHGDQSSGVYLYIIQAGDFRESKKMMLLK